MNRLKNYSFKLTACLFVAMLFCFQACEQAERENASTSASYQELAQGFKNPPTAARPKNYWWWLNGYTDSLTMIQELEAMKAAGIGGLDLFEIGAKAWYNDGVIPAGPAFLSEASLAHIKIAVEKAGELGLEVGFNTASSWNAGGSWIPPKYAAKSLYFSELKVSGPTDTKEVLPFPNVLEQAGDWGSNIELDADGRPVFYEEVAVLAFPAEQEVLDTASIKVLNSNFNPQTETLTWEVPAGDWVITRYLVSNSGEPLKTASPNSEGPIIDHYDPEATEFHFNYIAEKLESVLGDLSKTAIEYFYLASYEARGLTWTVTLPKVFKAQHGYEVHKFLPAIFGKPINSVAFTDAFKYDYNQTISELMIKNHYRKGREFCEKHDIKLASEAGGPGLPLHNVPVETLKALGSLDQPRGEFWKRDEVHLDEQDIDIMWLVKEIAAASHIYQRKIVEEEAFTSFYQWQFGPKDIKQLADRAFCEGMNRVVVHGASHTPNEFGYPGITYFAGTHYNNKRVWYPMVRPFNDYLARISWILQEANFQADVLYYYGDRAPNYVRPKNTTFTAGNGYDYEIINNEILLRDLYVEDGLLKLPYGVAFKLLVLDDEKTMNPKVLQKLKELAEQGAIIIGPKPKGAPGLGAQNIKPEIETLWQDASKGKPDFKQRKIWSELSPKQALSYLGVGPVFNYSGIEETAPDFIHYAKDDIDFFLVRNTTQESLTKTCSFRTANKAVEIWDPMSGNIIPLKSYSQQNGQTDIELAFEPEQSYFIVFSKSKPENLDNDQLQTQHLVDGKLITKKASTQLLDLSTGWQVSFDENWGAPSEAQFPQLISWADSEIEGIKYYSGIATYHKSFDFDKGQIKNGTSIFLDFEQIEKMARVKVNGKEVGILWCKPYLLDITEYLKNGENTLEIEVGNTWSNRLTGDAITGEKYTNTNITAGPELNEKPWAEVPLLPSGLIGKVELKSYELPQ